MVFWERVLVPKLTHFLKFSSCSAPNYPSPASNYNDLFLPFVFGFFEVFYVDLVGLHLELFRIKYLKRQNK